MSDAPATLVITSPVGTIELTADDKYLLSLQIIPGSTTSTTTPSNPILMQATEQIEQYFSGHRRIFDIPLEPNKSVRGEALRIGIASIPYGETLTYGSLAYIIESSPRAVGQACRRNPYPIIIPCHRVTSAAGNAENYSGGDGVKTKAWLNIFEQNNKEI